MTKPEHVHLMNERLQETDDALTSLPLRSTQVMAVRDLLLKLLDEVRILNNRHYEDLDEKSNG